MGSREHSRWERLGGTSLESILRSDAIALLDASWLVHKTDVEALGCRQDLPEDAFLSFDQIVAATEREPIDRGLHIMALSYMWLHPYHPDPRGDTLRLVRCFLQSFMHGLRRKISDSELQFALFWDYASLYQHPDPQNGHFRNTLEENLFREGLEGISRLFTHPNTTVLKVTKHPPNYPDCYDLPDNSNTAAYIHRGWPFTESPCWSNMTKDSSKTFDLALISVAEPLDYLTLTHRCVTRLRPAPLTPRRFDEKVQECSFTNRKDDQDLVMRLYRESVVHTFQSVQSLDFSGLGWDDEQVILFCDILREGFAPRVEAVNLGSNQMGVAGCKSLATALKHVPLVVKLDLRNNSGIGDKGCTCLAKSFHRLTHINLDITGITSSGLVPLMEGLNKDILVELCLRFNNIDSVGCESLERFARDSVSLKRCDLYGNQISPSALDKFEERCGLGSFDT